MDDEQIRQEIREVASDGKAACRPLLALAERLKLSPAKIGQLCNEMDIHICGCQLGCFG